MRLLSLIEKKRDGGHFTKLEIEDLVKSVIDPEVAAYQLGALLMAIYLRGLSSEETIYLTRAMVDSGSRIDLTNVPGIKVDKHSTGGVGDKTSLVLMPLVASMGIPACKLSGKGLGHTGGTLDKLLVFNGINTALTPDEFSRQVDEIGIAISGQTDDLVPADRILYRFRDLTGTVSSMPLIASSIMSKKIAAGADRIVLDVKVGSGSTLANREEAGDLAQMMIHIGSSMGVPTRAILSDMSTPLGRAIGNNLEVREAVDTLQGKGPESLVKLCVTLGSYMISMSGSDLPMQEIQSQLRHQLSSGSALNNLIQMIEYQNGNIDIFNHIDRLAFAPHMIDIKADCAGYVGVMDALKIGQACMLAGAGRQHKDDEIDLKAGIYLHKIRGEPVHREEPVLTLYSSEEQKLEKAVKLARSAFEILEDQPDLPELILEEIR